MRDSSEERWKGNPLCSPAVAQFVALWIWCSLCQTAPFPESWQVPTVEHTCDLVISFVMLYAVLASFTFEATQRVAFGGHKRISFE